MSIRVKRVIYYVWFWWNPSFVFRDTHFQPTIRVTLKGGTNRGHQDKEKGSKISANLSLGWKLKTSLNFSLVPSFSRESKKEDLTQKKRDSHLQISHSLSLFSMILFLRSNETFLFKDEWSSDENTVWKTRDTRTKRKEKLSFLR